MQDTKYYELTVWRADDNDQGQFVCVKAGITEQDFARIIKRKKRFVPIIIDDGDVVYIRTENVLDIRILNEF